MPFLLQLVGEGIRVFQAFDVAAAPRIAVPIPGAADPIAGLEAAHFEAELAQAVDCVEPADAGADDDRIKSSDVRGASRHFRAPCELPTPRRCALSQCQFPVPVCDHSLAALAEFRVAATVPHDPADLLTLDIAIDAGHPRVDFGEQQPLARLKDM